MNELMNQVKADLMEAIETDQIVLPTLPEVALQVRKAAADENIDVASLAGVISNDTALSARVIKLANSPLMRSAEAIDDLNTAVSRLGINYTANFATGMAMRQIFVATSPAIEQRMRAVWAKSTEISGISHILARQFTRLKPDQATLAGLVHKIGCLPILTYVEDHADLQEDAEVLDALIEGIHPAIGGKILEAWEFPGELRIVPEESVHYQREVAEADLADVVMIANLQSSAGSDHPATELDWSTIGAFGRLGLDCEINTLEAEDVSEELESAMALLQ